MQIPSVGTYSPKLESWVPKSFSTHRLPRLSNKPVAVRARPSPHEESQRSSELVPSFQHTVKRHSHEPKPKGRFDLLRPEAALNVIKKTNFQSVKLEESPELIGSSWQWAEKRRLKEEKLQVMKEIIGQMRSGRLFL